MFRRWLPLARQRPAPTFASGRWPPGKSRLGRAPCPPGSSGGRVAYPDGVEPEPRRGRRRIQVVAYDAEAGARELARLGRAVNDVRLKVPIAGTFPLAQASAAHRRLEQGHVLGRIALRIATR